MTRANPPHHAALDGLRALCLFGVLLFHAGFEGMSGGFLGVSTFFTLSGFLITGLLLDEYRDGGGISFSSFWFRRLRRLAPAALLTMFAIVVTAPLWVAPAARERLPADVLSSLVYATNWRLIFGGYDYARIFTEPSSLQHFWSLAIEAQFYLGFPLVVALLSRAGVATVRRALILATVAAALTPLLHNDTTRIYYGTDTRIAEILVGACLAALRPAARTTPAANDVIGLGVLIALIATWIVTTVESPWLYHGGLAIYALGSAVVIDAAVRPGRTARLLAAPGLPQVGRISYGAYLFHWPIFLALDQSTTGLSGALLFVLRTVLTLAVAALSYHFAEEPIRRRRATRKAPFLFATGTTTIAVGFLVLATSPAGLQLQTQALLAPIQRDLFDTPPAAARFRFAVFGDSTALALRRNLNHWFPAERGGSKAGGITKLGCGLLDGQMQFAGRWVTPRVVCRDYIGQWRKSVAEHAPDIAIVLTGTWEVRNWRASADAPPHAPGDPVLDRVTLTTLRAAVDALSSNGALVVWLTMPPFRPLPIRGVLHQSDADAAQPTRADHFNSQVRQVAAERRDTMRVVDLAGYMTRLPGGVFDGAARPDGVHLSLGGGRKLTDDWLGEAIIDAYTEWKSTRSRHPAERPPARATHRVRPPAS